MTATNPGIAPDITLEAMAVKKKLTYFGHVMRNRNGMGRDIMLGKTDKSLQNGLKRLPTAPAER